MACASSVSQRRYANRAGRPIAREPARVVSNVVSDRVGAAARGGVPVGAEIAGCSARPLT